MGDPVGSAVISGLVTTIFDKLGSPAFQEIASVFGVKARLKRLEHTLSDIKAVLFDADRQQTTQYSVRNWLQHLKDVAYDIEDLLDLISTQDLERNVPGRRRLDEIAASRRNYNFQECHQPLFSSSVDTDRERETHSSVREIRVVGREQDKDWIVTRLVSFISHDEQIRKLSVLPIVGIGGMGKTTLAKLVFNDPRTDAFEVKFWIYVPNKLVMRTVVESIIQCATGESFAHLNMETLKSKLCRILNAQTFLLVLDNVYVENSNEWLEFMDLLEEGAKRGALVVTTREDRVAALITRTSEAYKLQPLSEEHCFSIFLSFAFDQGEEEAYPFLVQIGKGIVKKCGGVPLAAKTLGSQLRAIRDEATWRSIEESEMWNIDQESGGILPSLKLSFDQLPYHLRPCFSACSALAKDSLLFNKDDVIHRWMALGLLQPETINETLEDVGSKYFDELLSRSFFEAVHPSTFVAYINQHRNNLVKAWPTSMFEVLHEMMYMPFYEKRHVQMHDLVHDLAIHVAVQGTSFMHYNARTVSERVRDLVLEDDAYLSERAFPRHPLIANKARSISFHYRNSRRISKYFLQGLISNYKCLRILTLSEFDFEELPNSIGDLKHMRYLNLGNNVLLKRLPNSICKLVNLQTLYVLNCVQLELIPEDLNRLLSLRYLIFTSKLPVLLEKCFHGWSSIHHIFFINCPRLRSLPEQIGTLTTLRILRILHCPILSSLPNSLRYSNDLKCLLIQDCENMELTKWEGWHGLKGLEELHIQRLPLLVRFPDGLQNTTFGGSLRYLSIVHCRNLVALPVWLQQCNSLLHLTLFKCPSLIFLPTCIPSLKILQQLCIVDCPKLNPRCERDIGDDWHLISHIPIIKVDHCFIQRKGFPTL